MMLRKQINQTICSLIKILIIKMLSMNRYILVLMLFALAIRAGLVPTRQIMLYPNTQNSPSLYLISFKTSVPLLTNQYILVTMDWLSLAVNPYSCFLVNTNIDIRCTDLVSPDFTVGFTNATLQNSNFQIDLSRTVVIQLLDPLPANVEYRLEIGLINVVENIKKISPSMEIYTIDNSGLIHEENLNFGPVTYKPPITNILGVNVYTDINDIANGIPGKLVSLKVQVRTTIPVTTSQSSMFFVLQQPFQFSSSSYITVDEAEEYATNPIALNRRPTISFYEVITPHIFYVAFDQSFLANRKFLLTITEIKNPFFIASSNVSIYTANFNSLTPLEGYQSILSIRTVTQTLTLDVGLPFDMPMVGPCKFYRNADNYYKIKFFMPKDVPAGYSIKVNAYQNTIYEGTAYVDFQSLNYTTTYQYFGGSYFHMKGMGPISEGSLISIVFKAAKQSLTNFYIDVFIDKQAVITAATASSYMFYGRANLESVDADDFFYSLTSQPLNQVNRISSEMTSTDYLELTFCVKPSTSTGSYVEMYMSPQVIFDPNFDPNADCMFGSTASSAVCTVSKTANYVYIQFKPSTSYSAGTPNAFPQSPGACNYIYLRIYKIRFPRTSSPKYPYQMYFRLFNSSAVNPSTYIEADYVNVLPKSSQMSGIVFSQHGNINTSLSLNYPTFVRFQSNQPALTTSFNYVLQENQVKIISIYSTYGFRALATYKNDDLYPCTSNIDVTCIYKRGIVANGNQGQSLRFAELQRIDIFFKTPGLETTTKFHIIIPDGIKASTTSYYYFYYQVGVYNKLTKDYVYKYRSSQLDRNPSWVVAGANNNANLYVNFQGKAGSYRSNVTVAVSSSTVTVNQLSFIVVSSSWSLFENDKSAYSATPTATPNVQFFSGEICPLSVKMSSGMYITVFPFKITSATASFNLSLDKLHMPYHYDLPNYYIFVISGSLNNMISSNQFEMTNQGIFYETNIRSLTINCLENYLGVQNTICTITFGAQNPLKADGKIILVFSGMNVATDVCSVILPNNTKLVSTCYSTSDNKNVSISLQDVYSAYHYYEPINNFTIEVSGISIIAEEISQSVTIYLTDSTGKYVIEKGNRILTTTVARPSSIQIDQIVYKYLSPLSANKMSIRFTLPRTIYSDEKLGFIMGKDLSDVNSQLRRLRIVLTRSDGYVLKYTNQLISAEYKVLFSFTNPSDLTPTMYTLQIFGIMTPVSHDNGAFSIIYQRKYDKAFTLTNAIKTSFPTFYSRISSSITMDAYFNTQGYEQKLKFTMVNTNKVVNSKMVWIINFPSYYTQQLFNYNPYCMIDSTPIQCLPDPDTRFQLVIRNSPKVITNGTSYTISVYRLSCPRAKYTNDYYRSYYIFIGVLETVNSDAYVESALLYPYQAIQSTVNGILTISDVTVNTLTKPTFSSIYATVKLVCNVLIPTNSYLNLIFPIGFDNFNNNNLNLIFKVGASVLFVTDAPVVDRTVQISLGGNQITANTQFSIEFPSLPTPKTASQVKMSQMIGFVSNSAKISILAATSMAGNSAPILSFTADPRYLSFNHDNTIDITAGTYSPMIDITASDAGPFLTNIVVNLTSTGFTFEPASVFLKLGDTKSQFRVGADAGLFPISYFYETIKSEQVFTYYTITKNNNIRVTNNPVSVTVPSTISIPIGGCSTPFLLDIVNPPLMDVSVSFSYDNAKYNQSIFWPNTHITKSQLLYSSTITQNYVSFCIASNFGSLSLPASFVVKFVFAGTNYISYAFSPSQNVTINVVSAITLPTSPSLSLQLINRQKTFLDFNITPTVTGNIFYHFQIGQDVSPLSLTEIQVYLKNNQNIIQSMDDFKSRLYVNERDSRVGLIVRTSTTMFTQRISSLLPQRYYTMCLYLETFNNIVSQPTCLSVYSQTWGVIMRASALFSSALTNANLNKVLCYFTKNVNTKVIYTLDLEGNSCYDRAVDNLYLTYRGSTFSSENVATNIYVITSPQISSDPSPTAFQNMYNSTGGLSTASLSLALSGFAISYLSSSFQTYFNAIGMISRTLANDISVSFDEPVFNSASNTITISNVRLSNFGSVYFVLVLYKQVEINGNNSYVKIRLNAAPNEQQILNCENWEGLPAEGCARAFYSYNLQTVSFSNILPNSMYMLYYITASQYPLRPIVSTTIQSNSIVTFVFGFAFRYLLYASLVLLLIL